MSRLFEETFDLGHLRNWSSTSGSSIQSSGSPGSPQGDTRYAQINGGANFLNKTLAVNESELYLGYFVSYTLTNATGDIFQCRNGATTLCSVAFNVSRKLTVKVAGTVQVTGTRVFSNDEKFHLEIHVKIADSGGVLEVRVDDILDASFTGDTKPGSETNISDLFVLSNSGTIYVDSFYVNNISGSKDNSWGGIVHMNAFYPDRDGTVSNNWGKSTGSTFFPLVDDGTAGPNDDTDYGYSQTDGQEFSVGLPAHGLPSNAVVKDVTHYHQMKKVTSGQVQLGMKQGGTLTYASAQDVGSNYGGVRLRNTENPTTGNPWQLSELGAGGVEAAVKSVLT
jgi:hypothetical protein